MILVEFVLRDDDPIYLNPAHVVHVRGADDGDQAVVKTVDGEEWVVRGGPEFVVGRLNAADDREGGRVSRPA